MTNHPDVLDELLYETLEGLQFSARNERVNPNGGHPDESDLLWLRQQDLRKAYKTIKSHYRSVEEIEAAIGEDEEPNVFRVDTRNAGRKVCPQCQTPEGSVHKGNCERLYANHRNQLRAEIRKALGLEGSDG